MRTLVMKFGGAALETSKHFFNVAQIIQEKRENFPRLVVVVSAMHGVTDQLTELAQQITKKPSKRELDMLISVGERVSMSLLAMALEEKGIQAISLTGSQSGIMTCTQHREARITAVRPHRIEHHLNQGKVVIVAGFQGVSQEKEITTLGRGGSDTSAVALGIALGAEKVEFYKDVKGIFSEDPKRNPKATLYKKLAFEEALKFKNPLHPRSILLASKNSLPLQVISFKEDTRSLFHGTWIVGKSLQKKEPCYEVETGHR